MYTGDAGAVVEIGALAGELAAAAPGLVDADAARILEGTGLLLSGRYAEAAPLLREAMAAGETSDDLDAILLATRLAAVLGDDGPAAAFCGRALLLARERGALGALPRILERAPLYELRLGRFAAAHMHASEGLLLAREMGQEPGPHLCALALLAAFQGREAECRAYAEEARQRAYERRSGLLAALAIWSLAALELGLGRAEEAFAVLEAAATGEGGLTHQLIAVFQTPDYVDAAVRTGRLEAARARIEVFEPWARSVGQPWVEGLLCHCRGLASSGEQAQAEFERALELQPEAQRPFQRARTELAYGAFLRRERRRREAREHLRAALQGFQRLGCRLWEERAMGELRATGETARKRDPSSLDQLTPQELQIVRLVGEGQANKQIATQLFLSPRTVEYHLRKVFAKLGISSRAELIRRGGETARDEPALVS
jgi:DNA-binding CsgD family transcriptional regulator